jgi:hypothetical protein
MDLIVRAFPVIPGREQQVRDFARAIRTARAGEAREFYSRYGVSRESWHMQVTPHGTWIIGVTQIDGMPIAVAAEQYSQSELPFDRWFKNQVHELSGINPDEQPLGPPTDCIFDTAMAAEEPSAEA